MVGVERFELPTSCTQSRRATRLRYTPTRRYQINNNSFYQNNRARMIRIKIILVNPILVVILSLKDSYKIIRYKSLKYSFAFNIIKGIVTLMHYPSALQDKLCLFFKARYIICFNLRFFLRYSHIPTKLNDFRLTSPHISFLNNKTLRKNSFQLQ